MKKWLGGLILSACIVGPAAAQPGYPNRPIAPIVTSVPGGVADVTGRTLAQGLTEAWGQPVIVENKGGAAHIIGAGGVAKSAPDGYTLLVGESGTFAVNPTLLPKDKVPYDTEKDFVPITGLMRIYQSLVAAKSLPVANTAELEQHTAPVCNHGEIPKDVAKLFYNVRRVTKVRRGVALLFLDDAEQGTLHRTARAAEKRVRSQAFDRPSRPSPDSCIA